MTAPASKELGQTKVATDLVPGSVPAVDSTARDFASEAGRITTRYDAFRAIRVEGWTGSAYLAFDANFDNECTKWSSYIKLLDQAEETLTGYSGALSSAQSEAQTAIDKWEAAERTTDQAVATYNQHVEDYNAYVRAPDTATRCVARPGSFVDPGQAGRDEAEKILTAARHKLEEAGHTALVALGMLEGAKTEGEARGPGAEGSASGGKFSWTTWEDAFGKDPSDGKDGRYKDKHEGDFVLTLGSVEGAAWVLNGEGSVEDYLGGGSVKVNADGSYTVLGADGSAEATIDGEGFRLNADGTATVASAEGKIGAESAYSSVGAEAKASVEASAEGHVNGGKDGLHAGGEVFAGARGSVEGSADVGGVGGTVGVEGWVGAGAAADVDLGYVEGKVTVGGSAGVAWGAGGKVSAEVVLDFPKIWETGVDMTDGVRSWFE